MGPDQCISFPHGEMWKGMVWGWERDKDCGSREDWGMGGDGNGEEGMEMGRRGLVYFRPVSGACFLVSLS